MPKQRDDNKKPKKNNKSSKSTKQKKEVVLNAHLYDELVDNTSIIFLHQDTINLLKTNKSLQDTVQSYIDAIYTIETKQKIKDKKANDFLTAYNSLTKQNLDLKILDKKAMDEIDDKLNFLPIFINNSLNKNWTDMVNSFKQKQANEVNVQKNENHDQPEKVETQKVDQNFNYQNNQNQYQSSTNFNAEDFMRRNNVSMDQIADNVIAQQAAMLLQKDIVDNKFYKYKTKPTFFLFIKWALFAMWIITAIALLINSFSFAGLGSGNYLFLFSPYNGGDSFANNEAFFNAVGKNIYMSSSGAANIFGYILSLFFPFAIMWYAYIQIKNYKNENAKFTCKTFVTWFLLIWIFFVLFANDINQLGTTLDISAIQKAMDNKEIINQTLKVAINGNEYTFIIDNQKFGSLILLSSISSIIYFVSIGLSVLLSVAVLITRPKVDLERMQAQINVYVNDIKSGKIPFDGSAFNGGMFGGARNPFSPY